MLGDWGTAGGRAGLEVGGFGQQNERGEQLAELSRRNRMVATHTWFLPKKDNGLLRKTKRNRTLPT